MNKMQKYYLNQRNKYAKLYETCEHPQEKEKLYKLVLWYNNQYYNSLHFWQTHKAIIALQWEKIFLLQVRKKHLQALVKLLDEAYYRTKLLYEMLK